MPTHTKPLPLFLKSSTLAVSTVKVYAKVFNLTKGGESEVVVFDANGEVGTSCPSEWEIGDELLVSVYGKFNKTTKVTIESGGVEINFGTLTEDTSSASVSL